MNEISQRSFDVLSDGVENQLLTAVERSDLRERPFDHIYIEEAFERGTFDRLLATLPDRRYLHELRHSDAMRADGSSTRLRMYLYPELLWRLPARQRAIWLPLAKALCSKSLEGAFKDKFRSSLEARFRKPAEKIRLYPIPILLRDQPGYRIAVHSDALSKAITAQFYFPVDSSKSHLGTVFHEGESGPAAERTTRMPFMPASGYAFPVSATKSWHSAATTTAEDGERVSVMVTYYVAEGVSGWLKYRWRRAKLLIGLHPPG